MTYALPGKTPTKVIKDQQWVHRNQLLPGMNVLELDVPWEQTNFIFQGFKIDSGTMLREVQAQCEYALVQIEKLAAVNSRSPRRLCGIVSKRSAPIWDNEVLDYQAR